MTCVEDDDSRQTRQHACRASGAIIEDELQAAIRRQGETDQLLGQLLVELGHRAIIADVMLFYGYLALTRHGRAVELQRDGSIAVDMITRKVREAASGDVTVSINPGVLAITTTSGRVSIMARCFDRAHKVRIYNGERAC